MPSLAIDATPTREFQMDVTWQEALDAYWYDQKDRAGTIAFQDWFRAQAGTELEAWFEVVRWKSPRSASKTRDHIERSGVTARYLETLCKGYVDEPRRETLRAFRQKIAKTEVVATAATFPAFIRPDIFPMVDTQTASWTLANPWTRIESVPDLRGGVLYERHWPYVWDWVAWCRRVARELGSAWTARDVEMAVFTAQRNKWTLPRLVLPAG